MMEDRLYLGHHGCGCTIFREGEKVVIDYCPKHDAAPDMYEALKELTNKFITAALMARLTTPFIDSELNQANKALAKAEGAKQ